MDESATPQDIPATDRPQESPASSPTADRPARQTVSTRRVAVIVAVVGLLAAAIGFTWALGLHEPVMSALFKPDLAPARGRITYNGKPMETGYVTTQPASSFADPAIGALKADGEFELVTNGRPGAAIGEHRLAVMALTNDFPPKQLVPARYGDTRTTPLTITVTSDGAENVFEFDLKDEAAGDG